jgi:hypothetical protein
MSESVDHPRQPLEREARYPTAHKLRYVGLRDAQQLRGLDLIQAASLNLLVDPPGKQRFHHTFFCVGVAEIFPDVATALDVSQIVLYLS